MDAVNFLRILLRSICIYDTSVNVRTYTSTAYVRRFSRQIGEKSSEIADFLALKPSAGPNITSPANAIFFGGILDRPEYMLGALVILGLTVICLAIVFGRILNDPDNEESSLDWELWRFKMTGRRKRRH